MGKEPRKQQSPQQSIDIPPFRQRFPWIGGDLQTVRDTLRPTLLPPDTGQSIFIAVPPLPKEESSSGFLLAILDTPPAQTPLRALVLLLHGLGGSSSRRGVRRLALVLLHSGFAVLRLNLRGADPGRHLISGTYAACCNSDMLPVLQQARKLCDLLAQVSLRKKALPLFGAGISLGGTILLNACLDPLIPDSIGGPSLDALVCASSPLDLAVCSKSIERPRNHLYQRWLLRRLVRQALADPFGVTPKEFWQLTEGDVGGPPRTIRAFDAAVTAPRWGYNSVEDYYQHASPLPGLLTSEQGKGYSLPPTLILQALDDPWVPAVTAQRLAAASQSQTFTRGSIQVSLTTYGGHNGFHGRLPNGQRGCWADVLLSHWLSERCSVASA